VDKVSQTAEVRTLRTTELRNSSFAISIFATCQLCLFMKPLAVDAFAADSVVCILLRNDRWRLQRKRSSA
jgi:hypothetical protein